MRGQMAEYLAVVAPLLKPTAVLGEYIQGGQREPARRSERAYKDLQAAYESVATVAPFNLPRELRPPFNLGAATLEVSPVEYEHVATSGQTSRTITVRSPLTWVLSYSGYTPSRLRELASDKMRSGEELQKAVLAVLTLHIVLNEQPGLKLVFEALRFPLTTGHLADCGALPFTRVGLAVSTSRPSDDVLVQSAELTGVDAFEEVVDVDDIAKLADPLKHTIMSLAQEHAPLLVRT
jgi:hypothetical protein